MTFNAAQVSMPRGRQVHSAVLRHGLGAANNGGYSLSTLQRLAPKVVGKA